MRRGESWAGIAGVNNEDAAVQESMGKLYDRSKEHLGTSDVAVIRMRRLMIESARRLARTGESPLGLAQPVAYERIHAAMSGARLHTLAVGRRFAGESTDAVPEPLRERKDVDAGRERSAVPPRGRRPRRHMVRR